MTRRGAGRALHQLWPPRRTLSVLTALTPGTKRAAFFSCTSRSDGTFSIVGGALWGKDLGSVESFCGSGFAVDVSDGCTGSLERFGEAG